MKTIVYGLGQIFQKYKDQIPMKTVEAFVDKKAEDGSRLFGIPVITPQQISQFEYDYIVVFSDKFFRQIARELHYEYNVPKEKIVSWKVFTGANTVDLKEVRKYLVEHIKAFHERSIIEFGPDMLYGIISPANDLLKDDFHVDGIGETQYPYERAFYDNVWNDVKDLSKKYDLAVIKPGMLTTALAKKMAEAQISRIILIENYDFEKLETLNNTLKALSSRLICRTLLPGETIIELIMKKEEDIDCIDYVVTHKKYLIEEDGLYKGLSVGGNRFDGLFSELDGNSIAEYNDRINETTGLYWIWKNTSSEFVGLSHYRRFFFNNTFQNEHNRLNKARIREILCEKGYDIILSELKELDWSIYENINKTVGSELNTQAYQMFYRAISEKQPDYAESFENVMQNNRMHICNMFVTRREILNEYCKWLFSFYLDVTDRIDVSQGTVYQKRVAGYYSEVFWTVWLQMQPYKVFELPLTNVYSDN